MTNPASPKFATEDDVTERFEGEFPSDRSDWVTLRIIDVENALMGLVPSLRKPLDEITAASEAIGDPGRLNRVRALVADKVLDMFRNPDGARQTSQTMGELSESRSYGSGRGATITFSDAELALVKLRKKRSRVGTLHVAPFRVT